MKNDDDKISLRTYQRMAEFVRIGNRAAREAQAENHRLGLPNIYSRNGKIVYEMPDGAVIIKETKEKETNENDEK